MRGHPERDKTVPTKSSRAGHDHPDKVIPSETILPAEVILSVARTSRSEVLAESKDPYLSQLVPTFLGTHLTLTFPSFRNVGSPYPP